MIGKWAKIFCSEQDNFPASMLCKDEEGGYTKMRANWAGDFDPLHLHLKAASHPILGCGASRTSVSHLLHKLNMCKQPRR
jgi:hypothetical protein